VPSPTATIDAAKSWMVVVCTAPCVIDHDGFQ
jgi:hypothetical protein